MNTATAPRQAGTYPERSLSNSAIPFSSEWLRLYVLPRVGVYAALTKPRIAVMVLATVAVGYTLGSEGDWQGGVLLRTLIGVALVAAASSALNQYLERGSDALMRRTAGRPLPSGAIPPTEALFFGVISGVAGGVWLAMTVNLLTSVLTLGTLALYVGLYTPLKRCSSLATTVGAVPGALPPVLGWSAAQGSLDAGAFSLFAILFLWQFPHFLAIAWLYRDQYEAAGLRMLPRDGSATVVGLSAVLYALALIPASLMPHSAVLAGDLYAVTAVVLGAIYLWGAVQFARSGTMLAARRLLWTSLIYLPVLFVVLTVDYLRLLR